MKRVYKCDLCSEEVKNPDFLFGLHFSNMHDFTLGGFGCTEGKHICYNCAWILRNALNNEEIFKELNRRQDIKE
jgi:hypothetical protein